MSILFLHACGQPVSAKIVQSRDTSQDLVCRHLCDAQSLAREQDDVDDEEKKKKKAEMDALDEQGEKAR